MKATMMTGTLIALVCCGQVVLAQDAARLRDIRIEKHHFTTEVRGLPRTFGVKDPGKGRWMVLTVSAAADGEVKLFSHDFVLRYRHRNGSEDRASCDGIAECDADEPTKINYFVTGSEPRITLSGPRVYFGLTACVEGDVQEVELCRAGTDASVRYRVGTDRSYSVFLTINTGENDGLSDVSGALTSAGYNVLTSTGLKKGTRGATIYYAPKAETAAREVSQRLMSQFDIVAAVKEHGFMSDHDIVVWLGEGTSLAGAGRARSGTRLSRL